VSLELLERPEPNGHFVQLYAENHRCLAKNVGHFLVEGWRREEGLLVIASPPLRASFTRELDEGGVPEEAVAFLDSQETLAQFMKDGQPDWARFEHKISAAIRDLRDKTGSVQLRAFGDMVGVLWSGGQFSAAIELENFWNRLLLGQGLRLFCAYPVDVFGQQFDAATMDALLCTHTHLLPAGENGHLDHAVDRAMDETMGTRANGLKALMNANYRPRRAALPPAENAILWLRNNLPDYADEILSRARRYYQDSMEAPNADA
jgi:DcmR-like sensory protein